MRCAGDPTRLFALAWLSARRPLRSGSQKTRQAPAADATERSRSAYHILKRALRPAVATVLAAVLGGCAAPALHSYVLATTPTPAAALAVETLPAQVIELRPVLLPEPLDTSLILRRTGPSELAASRNGRWADRLSVGVRLALAADLRAALPQAAVVTQPPLRPDFRRVSLTVTAFDLDASGTLTLDADWTVERVPPPVVLSQRRAHLVATGVPAGDAAEVAAMSALLRRLCAAIAQDL